MLTHIKLIKTSDIGNKIMATKTKKITLIDDSTMGVFKIPSYKERKLKAVYYGLQETWGQTLQAKSQTNWKKAEWEEFKIQFTFTFGTADNPKYSIEQMVDYSIKQFNKGLEELLEVNKRSWEKRELIKLKILEGEYPESQTPSLQKPF
jgi:hypothetical protein